MRPYAAACRLNTELVLHAQGISFAKSTHMSTVTASIDPPCHCIYEFWGRGPVEYGAEWRRRQAGHIWLGFNVCACTWAPSRVDRYPI